MQDRENSGKNSNIRKMPDGGGRRVSRQDAQPRPAGAPKPGSRASSSQPGPNSQSNGQPRRKAQPDDQPRRQASTTRPGPDGQPGSRSQPRPDGQPRPKGQSKPAGQPGPDSQLHRQARASGGQPRPKGQPGPNDRPGRRPQTNPAKGAPRKNLPNAQQAAKKKRRKIVLFVAEIFVLLILVAALWAANKTQNIQYVEIDPINVHINKDVQANIEQGTSSMQGYRNIALFGVDSRDKELDKNTRTDVIMVASINQDTKEVRLVSVYRDTWLNMTNDNYSKANAAYARGGAEQAIGMLNMNLDLDITDFVTVGFDGVIDVVDAIGGVEVDVKQEEISYLNDYQISMVGKVVGKNAAGEDEYYAVPYEEYTPVEHAGLQTLNGLQATAYCRIRYTSGGDGARTERQRRVLTLIAKKAMTLNPATLNKIADMVFSEISTSLTLTEILSLLSDITSYEVGETAGFPFSDHVQMAGRVGKASVVVPIDLTKNVTLLHEFLFEDGDYTPSETVKRCSQRIASDTGISYNGE